MKKYHILDVTLVTIIVLHMLYAIFMFTNSMMYGAIWLSIVIIEAIIYLIGFKKIKFFKYLLAVVIVLQLIASGSIMIFGTNASNNSYDKVLVLGYALDNDKMTDTLQMRLDKAYDYALANDNSTLILCGGITGSNTISEAIIMKDYLLDKGLDEDRIILEDKSTDTIENIMNALPYIGDSKEVLVISSNYHVYRARMICKKAGLKAFGLGSKAPLSLIPNQLLFEKFGIIGLLMSK